jgi:hypothetical protein
MRRIWRLFVVVGALGPSAAWPQGDPLGPEFRVNTYTTNSQRDPSVAVGGSGDFIVVWASDLEDGSGYGILGQRYSGSGIPLGPEFRVNTYTSDDQRAPSVAADGAGNFIVVWHSNFEVFGQRFAGSGAPLGPEFRVNSYPSIEGRPAVAADNVGNFVVVWQGGPSFDYEVFGQRYASSGAPLGPEFRVNTYAIGSDSPNPSIGSDSSGNFVVAWLGEYGISISGQRYSSAGAALGTEFHIATECLPCFVRSPAVASDSTGTFVVVWENGLYSYNGIVGQRYASSGAPLGGPFRANTYMAGDQTVPSVAADASGNFVVVWASDGQDGSLDGVFGQRYASSGSPQGPEFRINTHTTSAQDRPVVAADGLGNFVVTWMSDGQDGSAYGVYGQRFNMIVPVELMHFRVE